MANVELPGDVVSVDDLETRGEELLKRVTATGRPVVLTQHGRSVAVLLSAEAYEALLERVERALVSRAIKLGEADIAEGDTVSHHDVVAIWATRLAHD